MSWRGGRGAGGYDGSGYGGSYNIGINRNNLSMAKSDYGKVIIFANP